MPPAPVVILTQEEADSAALAALLAPHGIATLSYPCLATRYLPFDPAQPVGGRPLADYPLLAFTSKRGAMGLLPAREVLARSQPTVACVGPATALEVETRLGLNCQIMPDGESTGADLARAIAAARTPPGIVLHVRGDQSSGSLARALTGLGWEVAELVVYQNYEPELTPLSISGPALAAFASPSAVARFWAVNPELAATMACVAIGPVTSARLRQVGARTVYEAEAASQAGLAQAIIEASHKEEGDGI